jgi:aspartate oxidase
VELYNRFVSQGEDLDFHAFGPNDSTHHRIEKAPVYAVQFFPITRKTMGGVDVNLQCRVLSAAGKPIPGLFAAGEVTGFGGINGKAALEGTFLGPAILMGRRAAQAATNHSHKAMSAQLRSLPPPLAPAGFSNNECTKCHDLTRAVAQNRPGLWHFEHSHRTVLQRQYSCSACHQNLFPFRSDKHQLDYPALTNACGTCHGVQTSQQY